VSALGNHARGERRVSQNAFHVIQPQILRDVLSTLGRALDHALTRLPRPLPREPLFTRQVTVSFQAERARNATPLRYDIDHQSELLSADVDDTLRLHKRLDVRIKFPEQVGAPLDYLCIEFKYLDVRDAKTSRDYVNEGVDRIVAGHYSAGHEWAVMVGLEQTGSLDHSAEAVNNQLVNRYGSNGGYRRPYRIRLPHVHESEHPQEGGPHRIVVVHYFTLVA
jgi:hypothetical protein